MTMDNLPDVLLIDVMSYVGYCGYDMPMIDVTTNIRRLYNANAFIWHEVAFCDIPNVKGFIKSIDINCDGCIDRLKSNSDLRHYNLEKLTLCVDPTDYDYNNVIISEHTEVDIRDLNEEDLTLCPILPTNTKIVGLRENQLHEFLESHMKYIKDNQIRIKIYLEYGIRRNIKNMKDNDIPYSLEGFELQ